MLSTVKDACQPHDAALDHAAGDQIEHLADLLRENEKDTAGFFARNHVTRGMRELLRGGLARLGGKSDQAVFELRQAMGGGKTHSMLALGLLARDPEVRHLLSDEVTKGLAWSKSKLVTINGRDISDNRFIWGEIATQLDKGEAFAKFWKDGARAPTQSCPSSNALRQVSDAG